MTDPLLVCVHDATPAYAAQTRWILASLRRRIGRAFACAVVPRWHGGWPLEAHPRWCAAVRDGAGELLLHGLEHRRLTGTGWVSRVTAGSDELSGLDPAQCTERLASAQGAFRAAFGAAAKGLVPPAWQLGGLRIEQRPAGLEYVLGFARLRSPDRRCALATWSWDCGELGWTGRIGQLSGDAIHQLAPRRVPSLAIHPRDLARGYWPAIEAVLRRLLAHRYQPCLPGDLLDAPLARAR